MRIDQADPLVMLHIEVNDDGSRALVARGVLRGTHHTTLSIPLEAIDLADFRGHASELCSRTLDALCAIAFNLVDQGDSATAHAYRNGGIGPCAVCGKSAFAHTYAPAWRGTRTDDSPRCRPN
jgi:hypothetical protein